MEFLTRKCALKAFFEGAFLDFFFLCGIIHRCIICRPSDSTLSENAGIGPRTVATLALTARRSNHSARSQPLLDLIHTRLDLIHTRLDLIHTRLDLIHTRLDLIHTRVDLIHTRLDLIHTRLDLFHTRLDLIHTRLDIIHTRLDLIRVLKAAYDDKSLFQ